MAAIETEPQVKERRGMAKDRTNKPKGHKTESEPKPAAASEPPVGRPTKGEPVHMRLPPEMMAKLTVIQKAYGLDITNSIRLVLTRHIDVEVQIAEADLASRPAAKDQPKDCSSSK